MKKRLLTGAVCLSLAGMTMLTACSGKESAKKGNVELEILLADDTLEGGAMKAVVEKFNEEHKDQGVTAFVNEIAYADMETQIKNRAKAGNLPAICKMSNFDTYIDYVLPLDDTSLDPDNFNRSGVRNGKLYGTDVNDTAVGMVINKTAFDAAGVSYPTTSEERWTWDEFSAAVKEVAEKNEKITTPFVIDHSQQLSVTLFYHFGLNYFDPNDSTKVTFRSEDTKKGVEFFLDMFKEGGISKASIGTGAENAQDVFKTGTVAAHMAGNWVISDYTQNIKDFEWTPVLMPYEKEKATCLGGNWLYAFDGSGMEDQAKKFLEWFYQPENYSLYCQTGNYLPGTKDVEVDYEIEGINIFNMEIAESINQPQYDQSITEQEHSGENTGNALRDALDRAIAGELDADGVMDYVVTQFLENLSGVHE